MIGDNPKGDIYGANLMGWDSILVQTGIYQSGDILSPEHQPKYTVSGMDEALKLILNKY